MSNNLAAMEPQRKSMVDKIIWFCLTNKLVVVLIVAFIAIWGVVVAPFDWETSWIERRPVPVDAIPDIGENQQIVFTEWAGRSPQDVEDQVTYPLTVNLLGIPGVKTVRSYSFFGYSSIYVIFEENIEFYWSRSRILEKLNSLPAGTMPEGVQPALGPDATGLGQVFWYTLEGRDPDGNPVGGWDPFELRSVQDWQVRYALLGSGGVSEVSSIGGFVKEYQVDVDPDAMRAAGVSLDEVVDAVEMSNIDVGADTIEFNSVEYMIRGLGFIQNLEDIGQSVVRVEDNIPIRIADIANVTTGPEMRRGAIDKGGAEAVGGVVVVRYGENPLAVIKRVKDKIAAISPSLPSKAVVDYSLVTREEVEAFAKANGFTAYLEAEINHEGWLQWLRGHDRQNWPAWVTISQVTVVPFYDRTGLIYETLGTLNDALFQEILITIIVVIFMVRHLRSSILISGLLPLAVLMCFITMKYGGVDANIVALSGIAIAIGTMVDMGIIICENILRHLEEADPQEPRLHVVYRAASEVGSAVLTAVSTTVVSFLPVFTMTGAEGKLFQPLAYTKTFALVASVVIALTLIPPFAHIVLAGRFKSRTMKTWTLAALIPVGILTGIFFAWWAGAVIAGLGIFNLVADRTTPAIRRWGYWSGNFVAIAIVVVYLAQDWLPLGPAAGESRNLLFVAGTIGALLLFFEVFQWVYPSILRFFLNHKIIYMTGPVLFVIMSACAWLGFDRVFAFLPAMTDTVGLSRETITDRTSWKWASEKFPGLGKEFMPSLNEGSFLYMPSTMPHASIGEALAVIQHQDKAISAIPEVESVVGKIGRVDSPLDPAPISMVETIVNYKSEYVTDKDGRRLTFKFSDNEFQRDAQGNLIPDPDGKPFRQWRDQIRSPEDIWAAIVAAGELPGVTSAPMLQPIETRLIMLQTGMRAAMGIKVFGPDLESIDKAGLALEAALREVPGVEPATVFADRIVGKPYLEIEIDRDAVARYGLDIRNVQDVIEVAIGGVPLTMTVEGRERYPVRVRYMRELRDNMETLGRILVPAEDGAQIPLEQVADIRYTRGPDMIKSEDTFLVGYVLFDKKPGYAEVDVVESCQRLLREKTAAGELSLPAGVNYTFTGSYQNQLHAQRTLMLVLPFSLFLIFIILYFEFRAITTTVLVFIGIALAWAGGFILIWLYGQDWFLNMTVLGIDLRELFQVHPINLSVAVWVGFLALFGIATDDGVVIATYIKQQLDARTIQSKMEIRDAILEAGKRRIRPCLMTSATTILALLPVLTSTGRGSDIMVPMAIPSIGGMTLDLINMFMVPVLYCWVEEIKFFWRRKEVQG